MTSVHFSGPFIREMDTLSEKIQAEVWSKLAVVEDFPGMGSAILDPVLTRTFGPSCLKITAFDYDIIYRRRSNAGDDGACDDSRSEDEVVQVLGIVSQRMVR